MEAWRSEVYGVCWGTRGGFQHWNPGLYLEREEAWRDGGTDRAEAAPIHAYLGRREQEALALLESGGGAWWEGEGFKSFAKETKETSLKMWSAIKD